MLKSKLQKPDTYILRQDRRDGINSNKNIDAKAEREQYAISLRTKTR